ncbi:hypothetical protein [Streptomyces gardneri]|uniref:hypothetical protein n=1 Tax=Streptomyces gardneri TaxID=66892 RepID=UPI0036C015EC
MLKHVKDGRLLRSAGLQGIYRLAAGSAEELDQLIRREGRNERADEVRHAPYLDGQFRMPAARPRAR